MWYVVQVQGSKISWVMFRKNLGMKVDLLFEKVARNSPLKNIIFSETVFICSKKKVQIVINIEKNVVGT